VSNASGKLVIIGILTVALAAAGVSWWFRFNVTHRAAEFWGPKTARLIRDAPVVRFWLQSPPTQLPALIESQTSTDTDTHSAAIRDITNAHGFIHLRNALLDDRSFQWPPKPPASDATWKWIVSFHSDGAQEQAILVLTSDCKFVADFHRPGEVLSCEPIAKGLEEVFTEFSSLPPNPSR